MAVVFNKQSFAVEVDTGVAPSENWLYTILDLIDLLQDADPEMRSNNKYYYILELLRNMMPSEDQARKLGV